MQKIYSMNWTRKWVTAAAVCVSAVAHAGSVNFTYNTDQNTVAKYGFDKKENISVAIKISNPVVVGKKITSISVPVTDTDIVTFDTPTAFITTELKVENKENVANVITQEATITNGVLTCTFAEPYTITEAGVYVGYTLPVSAYSITKGCRPIAVAAGNNKDGLYIFATRSVVRWASKSSGLGAVSAMTVTLDGDFPAQAASLSAAGTKNAVKSGAMSNFKVNVTNCGTNTISSIDYTTQINDEAPVAGRLNFSKALPAVFGYTVATDIQFQAPATDGEYALKLAVTGVNGVPYSEPAAETNFISAPFEIVNRPLVEEFTGTWCGWCTRGLAVMEHMNEVYPDRFVAIAYHNGDPMTVTNSYPIGVSGFPTGCINRAATIDPYYFTTEWPKVTAEPANTMLSVELNWADMEQTKLTATTTVNFAYGFEKEAYTIGMALMSDGLTGPTDTKDQYYSKWVQQNYLSGQSATYKEDYFKPFTKAGSYITGYTFNDVLLSFPNLFGLEGSVPAKMDNLSSVSSTETFDITRIKNIYDMPVVQNKEKLYVIGVLFDGEGKPINSVRSAYAPKNAVDGISSVATTPAADGATYDLQGRRVEGTPTSGLYIRNGHLIRL